ncbi:MAG: hypothetical protein Q4B32_10015 [Clostridia bacterium]|nr:hypothetical protein [Clostridia bacterium]
MTITNHYRPEMVRPKLEIQTKIVFEPTDNWNYAHHPFITRFKEKFFRKLQVQIGHPA